MWISDRVTVIYLLDQSDSIPRAKREVMLQHVIKSTDSHRHPQRNDSAGLIVFGREAAIEFPPFNDRLPNVKAVESYFGRTDATNLEAALKLAQASFPEDTAKRVVIVTDGNETLGSATSVAKAMADAGIGIDVVPISLAANSEILVEKVDLPGNIRQGQPFESKIVINRYHEGEEARDVPGRLRLLRSVGPREEVLLEDDVVLDKDVNVFPIRDTIKQPAGYMYRAEFVPNSTSDDMLQQNNRADAFTYVRGKGRVLLIEDWLAAGEYSAFIEALRRNDIEVEVQPSNQLFTSLAELQAFDCVILAGVARSSGEAADAISNFSDDQIEMLVSNTEQFGCGLIMLGGPNTFGAGGWSNTAIEKAMPVDFQIKNKKIEAVGALAMILHASEIGEGNYWQKRIARSALEVLGPMDYCGVLQYNNIGGDAWLWGAPKGMLQVGENRSAMMNRLSTLNPQDMPDFEPSMRMAYNSLAATPASIKHMIIISDGDPTPPSNGVVNLFAGAQIKISTVAVGAHGPAGHQTLQKISTVTGGNYYVATNAAALPKIFMREAMRVARPLVYEPDGGLLPKITASHEVVQGLPRDLPNLKGFVLTSLKDSPLVEVPIRSSKPGESENQAVFATWNYGLGRTMVFTSDTGKRWAGEWTNWSAYDQFFSQMVRWAMRPTKSDAKFTVATNVGNGQVEVVVNALDQEDEFVNFLDMNAIAVGPDMKPIPVIMRQTAPGRYVGSFNAETAGSYLVNVIPGPAMAPITTGASIPFSDEYRIRQTNFTVLNQIANLKPAGGTAGLVTEPLEATTSENIIQSADTYRGGLQKARSLTDFWATCVLLSACCLLADIFVRRVALDYLYPIKAIASALSPKLTQQDAARQENLSQLRTKKSQVSQELDQQKATTRFEVAQSAETADPSTLDDAMSGRSSTSESAKRASAPGISQKEEAAGYTSRLLAAKKAAQKKPSGEKNE